MKPAKNHPWRQIKFTPPRTMAGKIWRYRNANPKATYKQIAEAVGCGLSTVGKVLRREGRYSRPYGKGIL